MSLQGLTKFKQIQGLDAIHALFQGHLDTIDTQVSAIEMGQPSLTGKVVTIPFTDATGITVNKTLDLSTLVGPDIHIQAAAIAPNSFDIIITETDGGQKVVPLKALFDQYLAEYIQPLLDAKADKTSVDALTGRVTTVENVAASKASQASVDSLTGRVTSVETLADSAKSVADAAKAEADTTKTDVTALTGRVTSVETLADSAKSVADAAKAEADTTKTDVTALTGRVTANEASIAAIEAKDVVQDARIDALEASKITGVVPVVMVGKPTINDGDAASDDVVPANVKHITSLQINGEFVLWGSKTKAAYFSKDGGATAVTANLGGAKLYWNKSVIEYNIAADDQIVIVAIV